MKFISAGILLICIISGPLVAQNKPFGPEFKNQKPWEKKSNTKTVFSDRTVYVFGPEYKNKKTWEVKKTDEAVVPQTRRKKKIEFGPAFKNRKPWN